MPYRNDKVSDVIAVLTVMRNEFKRTSNYRGSTELRKKAVKDVAEKELELSAGRYKDERSAFNTIHDACARRLKLDIRDFDGLTDQWLCQNPTRLKDILLKHSKSRSQHDEVTKFFEDKS